MALSTDFKDDVLASSNSKRKYNMIHNPDGTVSFEDVTVYSQEGSDFGAKEVNEEREEINKHTTLLGDTDISSIEDGTVTGAIAGLNGKLTRIVYKHDTVTLNEHGMFNVRHICSDERLINVILLNEQYELRQMSTDNKAWYRVFNPWTGSSVSSGNYYIRVIYFE